MSRMISRAVVLFAMCMGAAATLRAADPPQPLVALEAEVIPGRSGERFGASLAVRLVGVAEQAKVATQGFQVKVDREGAKAVVALALVERKDSKGRRIIPSVDALGLVDLKRGEVATVQVPFSPGLREALSAAAAGKAEVSLEYETSEWWGERFGVVSGKFRTAASIAE